MNPSATSAANCPSAVNVMCLGKEARVSRSLVPVALCTDYPLPLYAEPVGCLSSLVFLIACLSLYHLLSSTLSGNFAF